MRFSRCCADTNSEWRDQVIGGCLYGFNAAETITSAVPDLAEWITKHPTPTTTPPPVGTRGAPREQYQRVYNVIPQNATEARAVEIFLEGWRRSRETAGGSPDDSGIGDLDVRIANVHNLPADQQQTYKDWYAQYYPGVVVNFPASAVPVANAKPGCLPVPKAILRRFVK